MARQSTEGPSSSTAISKIAALETKLLSTPYNPNPLVQLLNFARHPAPDVVHKAIWALHRVFIRYIKDGKVGGISDTALRRRSNSALEAEDDQTEGMEAREVRGWVRDRLLEYVEVLGGLVRDREPGLRVSPSKSLLKSLIRCTEIRFTAPLCPSPPSLCDRVR